MEKPLSSSIYAVSYKMHHVSIHVSMYLKTMMPPPLSQVREAVAILDLDVMMRPCPRDGPTFRPAAIAKGGKAQFPFMVDPNTGAQMYESDDIIRYLFETYGPGGDQVPLGLRLGPVTTVTCALANAPRAGRGAKVVAGARPPAKPVTLWGYEASPFVKASGI